MASAGLGNRTRVRIRQIRFAKNDADPVHIFVNLQINTLNSSELNDVFLKVKKHGKIIITTKNLM